MSDLIVKPIDTKKSDLPQSPYMKNGIINKYPSMLLNVGRSGSGKTTVLMYMLNQPNFLKGFYDKIYYFSPTAELDDLVNAVKIPKKNLIKKNFEEELNKIISKQEGLVKKHGIEYVGKKSKVLIIFDDIISNQKFLKSPEMLKLASMGRHFLISSIINTQSFTKVPRALRLQANSVILFPSSENEMITFSESYTPPHTSKKKFMKLIEYATNDKHSFLFVNLFEPPDKRFRKGFTEYLIPN